MSDHSSADLNGKSVLFVAYFYPPIAATGVPGAMRTIKLIRNLSNGKLTVLSTTPLESEEQSALPHINLPANGERIYRVGSWDIFKLLLLFRQKLRAIRTKNHHDSSNDGDNSGQVFKSIDSAKQSKPSLSQRIKDFVYNLSYFPDQAGPWILPAFIKGRQIISNNKVDVIFATGSPWSGLVTGYLISKWKGVPLIADFRDPWINNPFHISKGSLLDSWSKILEKKVVEHASAISLNTEPLKEEFLERYHSQPKNKFFVMPNGFDSADFQQLTKMQSANHAENTVTLCHAGFLYGVRDPAVLLTAIRKANKLLNADNVRLRFRQIGDVELSYKIEERFSDMVLDGSLVIDKARPYVECLEELQKANWLVNVQPATKTQVPSKLYDYLAMNRPILNITPSDGALGYLVKKYGLGKLFTFDAKEDLVNELVNIAKNRNQSFEGYPEASRFSYKVIASELASKIEEVT